MTIAADKPRHIAIIMDGNGRWAKRLKLPRVEGHRRGVDAIKKILPTCSELGVSYLTLFAFSSENWKRPEAEVRFLIELLTATLVAEIDRLHKNKIKLRVIGELSRFPQKLQRRIQDATLLTQANTALNLTVAVNYGGQWDILQACRAVAEQVENRQLKTENITSELLELHLSTHDLPQPDLFIRTGGDLRVSNFLLWQLAYTELYFTDTLWPDFDQQCLHDAVKVYASRQRRFGRTGEQLETPR